MDRWCDCEIQTAGGYITGLTEAGSQTIAAAQVSGSFPGSPAQIRYKFTLRNGKIAALAIGHEPNDRAHFEKWLNPCCLDPMKYKAVNF